MVAIYISCYHVLEGKSVFFIYILVQKLYVSLIPGAVDLLVLLEMCPLHEVVHWGSIAHLTSTPAILPSPFDVSGVFCTVVLKMELSVICRVFLY